MEETDVLCRESLDCENGEFAAPTGIVISGEESIYVESSWWKLDGGGGVLWEDIMRVENRMGKIEVRR